MYVLEDYLNFRGDLSFKDFPVNDMDEIIFTSMGKADYSNVFLKDQKAKFVDVFQNYFAIYKEDEKTSLGLLESPILMKTLAHASKCPRYKDIEISCFENDICTEKMEQMSCLTVLGPDKKIYVTFRGTDDTFVGWKENCYLAIHESVQAQRSAASYLEKIAAKYPFGKIVVSGHSKGGNLAVYSAANVSPMVQKRIEKVVSYDGPGFMPHFFESEGYKAVQNRIITMVPYASLVGMLMNHAGKLDIIACENRGPYAHDIFIWNLEKDTLLRKGDISDFSKTFHEAISQTLDTMDMAARESFVNELFDVLSSTGADKFLDFTKVSPAELIKLAGNFSKAKEIKKFILTLSEHTIKDAVGKSVDNISETVDKHIGAFAGAVDKGINDITQAVDKKLEILKDTVNKGVQDAASFNKNETKNS